MSTGHALHSSCGLSFSSSLPAELSVSFLHPLGITNVLTILTDIAIPRAMLLVRQKK